MHVISLADWRFPRKKGEKGMEDYRATANSPWSFGYILSRKLDIKPMMT